jgi:hypothetical protein
MTVNQKGRDSFSKIASEKARKARLVATLTLKNHSSRTMPAILVVRNAELSVIGTTTGHVVSSHYD